MLQLTNFKLGILSLRVQLNFNRANKPANTEVHVREPYYIAYKLRANILYTYYEYMADVCLLNHSKII